MVLLVLLTLTQLVRHSVEIVWTSELNIEMSYLPLKTEHK